MNRSTLLKSLLICMAFLAGLAFPYKAAAAVPAAPSHLIAVAGDATSIALSWQDNSSDENTFNIYRKTDGTAYAMIGQVGPNHEIYGDSGLQPGTKYYYVIKACNSSGLSASSNTASDTTEAAVARVTSPNGGEVWKALETRNITWTSNGEGFQAQLRYRLGSDPWVNIDTVPNTNTYSWTVPNVDSTHVRVAVRLLLDGDLACVDQSDTDFTIQPFVIHAGPYYTFPNPPSDLSADAEGPDRIHLSWDFEGTRDGIEVERKSGSGAFAKVGETEAGANQYGDTGLNEDTAYTYRIRAYYNTDGGSRMYSAYSNEATATTPKASVVLPPEEEEETTGQTVLRFYIDSTEYYVKGPSDASSRLRTMDTAPIISGGRTLLPIRYVSEPLGADVDWDGALDQVTVQLGGQNIVLWINNSTARINDVETLIDPANPAVTPIIVPPGRTMLPLRFIAENLGCQVDWNAELRQVTVTYPKL